MSATPDSLCSRMHALKDCPFCSKRARIAELEAEKARALDRLDEMYLARTELEKKQITLLSNYGRLETALRAAEKALAEVDSVAEHSQLNGDKYRSNWCCEQFRYLRDQAREALTAIRAALHGEGK